MTYATIKTLMAGTAILALSACGLMADRPQGQGASEMQTVTPDTPVRYDFVRNATARLHYGGKIFLLDPMLSDKGALPSFAGVAPNPTVALPIDADRVIAGIDGVIVGHMHADHFDATAAALLPKDTPLLVPANSAPVDPGDLSSDQDFKARLEGLGFTQVTEIGDGVLWQGVGFDQVWGRHGHGDVAAHMGGVNGIILRAEGQPTVYWTGDTVLDAEGRVLDIVDRYEPDIVIAHTGGPVVPALSDEILLMDAEEAAQLFRYALSVNPDVSLIAVHMDSLDHSFSTRADLMAVLSRQGLSGRVSVPQDGETVTFR
ncbi:MAG: MBL fold metallo-hydrolase [Litorimonas sp.]